MRSTQSPIGTISPDSSASGMNWLGGTIPSSGCFQRISASSPTICRDEARILGWKLSVNSSRSSALRSCDSRDSFSSAVAFIARL